MKNSISFLCEFYVLFNEFQITLPQKQDYPKRVNYH